MHTSNPVARVFLPLARALSLIAGYGLLGLALLVTVEILSRRFLNLSLQGGDEFGGYVLAILAAFGFTYALLERAHTRVEILLERVSGNTQAVLNAISAISIAFAACFMAWRAYAAFMESIEYRALSGTPLMTPLWQPQSVWLFGLIVFAIISTAIAVHSAQLLVHDRESLNRYYGVKSLAEIIEEETVLADDLATEAAK